jgi:hypothetical protein
MLAVREMETTATSPKGFEAAVKGTIKQMSRTQKVVGWDILSLCCESSHEGEIVYRASLRVKVVDQV